MGILHVQKTDETHVTKIAGKTNTLLHILNKFITTLQNEKLFCIRYKNMDRIY